MICHTQKLEFNGLQYECNMIYSLDPPVELSLYSHNYY